MDLSFRNLTAPMPPMLTIEAYAELTHQKKMAVSNQVKLNILPIIQPTGHSGKVFINMVALVDLCKKVEENKEPHNRATWF